MRDRGVLLAHPGVQHSFRLARELHRQSLLGSFWAGGAFVDGGLTSRLISVLPKKLRAGLQTRRVIGVPATALRSNWLAEIRYQMRYRLHSSKQLAIHRRNLEFQSRIPLSDIECSRAVVGFDTSSWLLARRAKSLGRAFILDQTSPHPDAKQEAMDALRSAGAPFVNEIETRLGVVREAEEEEHQLADRIVVASAYSRETLIANGIPEEKLEVIPYGVDLERFRPAESKVSRHAVRFLFLGSLSAHKGVPLLLSAWNRLNAGEAELWLVGAGPDRGGSDGESTGVRFAGKVSHADVVRIMSESDVLVLPSLFEGFGLVLLEALAMGLPIIASEATGGPDLIGGHGCGWIVPPGDVAALTSVMQSVIDSPERLKDVSASARRRAQEFTWDAYGRRWRALIEAL